VEFLFSLAKLPSPSRAALEGDHILKVSIHYDDIFETPSVHQAPDSELSPHHQINLVVALGKGTTEGTSFCQDQSTVQG
jgi:hypothetical protein